MDEPNTDFTLVGTLEEAKAKGRIVVHGAHRPILIVHDRGSVFALDNRCPHMGFPLDGGSVEDGILTCHWRHARFDLASGCTFDLWADDTPCLPVEVRDGEVWVKTSFGHADSATHWRRRLNDGLMHDIGLVIAKAVQGQRAAGVPKAGGLAPINGPTNATVAPDCSQWRNATEAPLADVLFTLIPVKLCCRTHRT